ncbi:MAG: flavodoxin domain-containing protein [Pseudomonadota bacterium]
MKVMIAYSSIEGQTAKIARFLESEIQADGHEVALEHVTEDGSPVSFEGYSTVILAGSVHERRHPKAFEVLLASHRDELETRRTLLISVSLKAAFEDGVEEAQDYLDEMKMRTGFTPEREMLVAGAVRSGSYDYFQSQVVQHVLLRGQDYDPSEGEREFTDWSDLSSTVRDFLGAETSD